MSQEKRARILYVEDDPSSAALVKRVLRAEGFEVEIVTDGVTALEVAPRLRPALILMDINVSGLDGYEVTTHLRSIEEMQHVPIVAVTASTMQGDRERALIAGCNGYIPKPIDIDRFPKQVDAFLGGLRESIESPEEKAEYLVEYNQRLVERLKEKIREVEEAHTELQRVEKMKSDFIILASHELRTPLTSIYGFIQMLLNNPNIPGSPEEEGSPGHLLHCISDASKRLSQVFDEIRNISLIDADRLNLTREPVKMEKLVRSVVKSLEGFGPERDLQFVIEDMSSLPTVLGDSRRLRQAMWNIISNAMKFTPDGGYIYITGHQIEDTVHIAIQDTGVGIPLEERERVFDRFYVLEDTNLHHSSKTAFKGGGLGLGLTVARGIIEGHDGKVWVESEGYDEERLPGSTFHVLLPLVADDWPVNG